MKQLFQILLIIFVLQSLAYPQWENQSINLPRGDYFSVYMQDCLVGWIGGSILLKTVDGGNTWVQHKFVDDQEPIYDIKFLDDSVGFAESVTNNQTVIYKTSDGGKTWQLDSLLYSISISTGITFGDISFSVLKDSTTIWCIGYNTNLATGFVYYSIDKSRTWKQYDKTPVFDEQFLKITFIDSFTGFFVTKDKLFRTTNSGNTWQQYPFDSIGISHFINFHCFNSDTSYFTAQGPTLFSPLFIGKTFDGGESWSIDSTAQGFFTYLTMPVIHFINPDIGFAIDWSKNIVKRTTDGGSHWIDYVSTNPFPLFSIHSFDGKTVVATGCCSHILVSKNSGLTWNNLTPPSEINLEYIKYFSNDFIIAFDGSNIYHSFDSCSTWTQYPLPTGLDVCITLLDSLNGWIADDSSRIYNTTDSGITWNIQREFNYLDPNTSLDPLKGIHFFNENIGCSVGGNGYITATTDGGKAWKSKVSPTSKALLGVFVASTNRVWSVGEEGTIITSSDCFNSWTIQQCPINSTLHSVTFLDTLNGFILGDDGIILKTINGGLLWEIAPSPNSLLNAMEFIDTNTGWVVADNGEIFRTLNGGEEWEAQESGVESNLTSVDFFDNNLGLIVGDDGIILSTQNGGVISNVKNNNPTAIPTIFELQQNYPNPFNPTTNIEFWIAEFGLVSLKVYDVLGREVATLVNEEKIAGMYEVNFNASSLTSGVYIYKIRAGDFVSSKKMILLK